MKALLFFGAAVATAMLSTTAFARSIQYDSGQWDSSAPFPGSNSNGTADLDIDGITLQLSPGNASSLGSAMGVNDSGTTTSYWSGVSNISSSVAYEFNWGSDPTSTTGSGIQDQIIVYQFANPDLPLEVDFNYAGASCPSTVATLSIVQDSIGNLSSTNPCANTGSTANVVRLSISLNSAGGLGGLGESAFGNWTTPSSGPPVSAPELDPSSAAGGITMVLGSLAVIAGRRRWRAPDNAR
jgi:hypothetical protein